MSALSVLSDSTLIAGTVLDKVSKTKTFQISRLVLIV